MQKLIEQGYLISDWAKQEAFMQVYPFERDQLVVSCSMLGMARALDHLLSQGSISFSAHEQAKLFTQQLEREDLLSLLEKASIEQLNNLFVIPI